VASSSTRDQRPLPAVPNSADFSAHFELEPGAAESTTCAGRDKRTGQPVRFRRAPTTKGDNGISLAYELALCSRVEHPGVAKILYVAADKKGLTGVFSCPPGNTLEKVFAKSGTRSSELDVLRHGLDMAALVGAAHAARFLLLEVGPANFVLDPQSKRLGLVQATVCLPLESSSARERLRDVYVGGVWGYMAPEQVTDVADLGPHTDVFGVGATLFRLLAGRPIYETESTKEAISQTRNAKVPDIARLRKSTNPKLASLINRCLAKAPKERPATAQELAAGIHSLLEEMGHKLAGRPQVFSSVPIPAGFPKDVGLAERLRGHVDETLAFIQAAIEGRSASAAAAPAQAGSEREARAKAERERLQRERAETQRLERERLAQIERDQEARAKAERERLERERGEAARQERERLERIQREQEARAKAERERLERERAEAERQERERLEQIQREQEAHAKAERERLERERAEAARQERERLERIQREQEARAKAERERLERERAEAARQERERLEQIQREQEARAKAERERLERERAEAERQERERLEQIQREQEARAETEGNERERLESGPRAKEELENAARENMTPRLQKGKPAGGIVMATQTAAPHGPVQKVEAPEPKAAPAGEVLPRMQSIPADRYQVRREIGLGGQGACKVAYDQLAEREVVLKVSGPQGGWSADRLIKEARVAARFNHPNVSRLLELGALGKEQVFMTMPSIEGFSLDQVLKKISEAGIPGLTGYSIMAVAELFEKVCAGVEHAHSAGILHLDLKPQNVVVGSHGEVLVVDWGLSQPLNAGESPKRFASNESSGPPALTTTLTGVLPNDPSVRAVGTPAYMAPEQWAGDPGTFTERTDIYGLGGILFFLLTGSAPNQVQRPTDLEPYFRHSPTPLPSDFTRRRVPPELENLCTKCLARDPAQRYPSVFHVRHVLKSWLSRPEMWGLYGASY